MKVDIIKGKGYMKYLFSELGTPNEEQFSLFFWESNGKSVPHNHSVDEITYVVKGELREIRRVGKGYEAKAYKAGNTFEVPAGTEHVVEAANVPSVTINWCKGALSMDLIQDFMKELAPTM